MPPNFTVTVAMPVSSSALASSQPLISAMPASAGEASVAPPSDAPPSEGVAAGPLSGAGRRAAGPVPLDGQPARTKANREARSQVFDMRGMVARPATARQPPSPLRRDDEDRAGHAVRLAACSRVEGIRAHVGQRERRA